MKGAKLRRVIIGLVLACLALLAAGCGGGGSAEDDTGSAATASAVPFDRAFIDGMVPHHEEAIAMAKQALAANLATPELVSIAKAIVTSQQDEIDRMKRWRGEWFGSAEIDPNGADTLGLSMEQMGMQHDAGDLSSSEDVDADFATMMIDHHNGAIAMAKLAREEGQHEEIRDLGDAIIRAQEREIAIMREHAGMHH